MTQFTMFQKLRPAALLGLILSLMTGCQEETTENGRIAVNSDPAAAEIYLNGNPAGETPKEFTGLGPGEYVLELRKEGFNRAYRTVALVEGRKVNLNVSLMPQTGLLLVDSDPPGSEVLIAGEVRGTTPALLVDLPLGTYELEIRASGLPDRKLTAELKDRNPVRLQVQHAPRIAVNSYPPGAEVLVDGEVKGVAPLVIENISLGDHRVLAQLDQHDSQEKTVTLVPGLNDAVEFNLEKNSGTLVLDTEPANVEVYVDGTLFATTQPKEGADSISQPVRIALKAGINHRIQLVREGYLAEAMTVKTDVDEVLTRHEVLKRIFVYDTKITTKDEVILCRMEYKLPNGNIYYERFPGVYNTAKADEIVNVEPVSLDDASNKDARQMIRQSQEASPQP